MIQACSSSLQGFEERILCLSFLRTGLDVGWVLGQGWQEEFVGWIQYGCPLGMTSSIY
jgi:hypothetical protein